MFTLMFYPFSLFEPFDCVVGNTILEVGVFGIVVMFFVPFGFFVGESFVRREVCPGKLPYVVFLSAFSTLKGLTKTKRNSFHM